MFPNQVLSHGWNEGSGLAVLTHGWWTVGEVPPPPTPTPPERPRGGPTLYGLFWSLVYDLRHERERQEFERIAYAILYLLLEAMKKHAPKKYIDVLVLYLMYLIFNPENE